MKVLLIVQPERIDFYNYLKEAPGVEWYLLWHEKAAYAASVEWEKLPIRFTKIYYWDRFVTPSALLRRIRPDRLVFFEIIDLRQIALIVTARHRGVPTFYLEHGAAGSPETAKQRWKEVTLRHHKLPYYIERFTKRFWNVVKAKVFYYAVTKGFRSAGSYQKYLLLPLKMMNGAPNKVLTYNRFPERVPDKCIVFNQVNYDEFELYTGVRLEDAVMTGVPFFDKYYDPATADEDYVVYIDHPYYEEGIAGWTKEHHDNVAEHLFAFAQKNKVRLFIKLHPRSNRLLWTQKQFNQDYVTIIQDGDFTDLYLKAKLILGFSSSLITGFLCARKNIVFLGWHPEPQIFGADFSKTGLCHLSLHPEELETEYQDWLAHNKTQEANEAYVRFLKTFNYPFDGKATNRVIAALLHDEVS